MNRKKPFRLRKCGDKGYHLDPVPEIDQYIPEAVRYADKIVTDKKVKVGNDDWSRIYHAEMDRLVSEAGLRVV